MNLDDKAIPMETQYQQASFTVAGLMSSKGGQDNLLDLP
jgi:hypothetical protein